MTNYPAGLYLFNGNILAFDQSRKLRRYNDLVIERGKISGYGRGDPNGFVKVDLKGATALPGLCDAHMHMAAGGRSLTITNLGGMGLAEIRSELQRLRDRSNGNENLVEVFNWDEKDDCRLNAKLLEEWFPSIPLLVHKRDLHGCCVNLTALKAAGVDENSVEPAGGTIERGTNGLPTGMLFEAAIELLESLRPPFTVADRKKAILEAQAFLVSLGVTGISEVLDHGNAEVYRLLEDESQLRIDVDGWVRIENWDGKRPEERQGSFRSDTIKIFLDGSFGSHNAAMFEPFSDTGTQSELFYSDAEFREMVETVFEKGWRVAVHAIGDRAVDQAARVLGSVKMFENKPHRIEHLQQVAEGGIPTIAQCKALASLQPVHFYDDRLWLESRIGKRCRNSFKWKSLIDHGVPLAFGSDWPVASPDPLENIRVTTSRRRPDEADSPLFDANEIISPEEAIFATSTGFAVASGRLSQRGLGISGHQADLTIVENLSEDLRDWNKSRVAMTIVKGEILFNELN